MSILQRPEHKHLLDKVWNSPPEVKIRIHHIIGHKLYKGDIITLPKELASYVYLLSLQEEHGEKPDRIQFEIDSINRSLNTKYGFPVRIDLIYKAICEDETIHADLILPYLSLATDDDNCLASDDYDKTGIIDKDETANNTAACEPPNVAVIFGVGDVVEFEIGMVFKGKIINLEIRKNPDDYKKVILFLKVVTDGGIEFVLPADKCKRIDR